MVVRLTIDAEVRVLLCMEVLFEDWHPELLIVREDLLETVVVH